jgi:poly [ADP-ribose] polymerase
MARKAAPKPAPAAAPLDGCSIAASGRFPGGVTQSTLQARLTSLGAEYASIVSADTTHLIATSKDFESNSTKVKAAAAHNVPVITLDWLDECEATGKFTTF